MQTNERLKWCSPQLFVLDIFNTQGKNVFRALEGNGDPRCIDRPNLGFCRNQGPS